MRKIWEALLLMILSWIYVLTPSQVEEEELTDDDCQCSHARSFHTKGIGKCHVGRFDSSGRAVYCVCKIFVKKGGGQRESKDTDPDPNPSELEEVLKCLR